MRCSSAPGSPRCGCACELEGFVFNRLQGAMLREAYALVRDGVASVADIDRIVSDGLGRRWSVIGPFETVDLNVRGGIAAHAQRMGPAYARMGAERGDRSTWTDELVARVAAERRAVLPLDRWDARVEWRDRGAHAACTGPRGNRSVPAGSRDRSPLVTRSSSARARAVVRVGCVSRRQRSRWAAP